MEKFAIYLTEEQHVAVRNFFESNEWELNMTKLNVNKAPSFPQEKRKKVKPKHEDISAGNIHKEIEVLKGKLASEPNPTPNECAFCFLVPCVTQVHRPRWLGDGQRAAPINSAVRKELYKKYWFELQGRGAWDKIQYQLKKRQTLVNQYGQNHVWVNVAKKRDIMPECVLEFVRRLYPNPDGQPYMGHKWQ